MTSTAKLPSRIEHALAHLAYIRDFQLIIQLVEHWHTIGEPTAVARLAAVDALIQLCQMDRAWARLRELLQEYPKWTLAHATAAELFLQRGWKKQARKPLEEGLRLNPKHPRLLAIQNRIRTDVDEPPESSERPTTTELLAKARRFLSTGSPVRGRAILYQIRKAQSDHPEVTQLLWACASDFSLRDTSLWSHYANHDHEFDALADLGEEPELTESSLAEPTMGDSGGNHPNPFTNLFLHDSDAKDETTQHGEKTQSIDFASNDELERGDGVEYVRLNMARDGDTEIRRILTKGGSDNSQPNTDRIHANLPDDLTGFNLDSFRREMGMNDELGSDIDETDDIDPMEEEDADLIVLVRSRRPKNRKRDDPTSEFLVPDSTTSEKSEEIFLSTAETPRKPTRLKPKAKAASTTVISLAWLFVIAILLLFGIVSLILLDI